MDSNQILTRELRNQNLKKKIVLMMYSRSQLSFVPFSLSFFFFCLFVFFHENLAQIFFKNTFLKT